MISFTKKKELLSWLAFSAVLLCAVSASLLYLYNIVSWRDYPDFGVGFNFSVGIEQVGYVTERGERAGVEPGDRILSVNGRSYSTFNEYRALLNRGLGQENTYVLDRNGAVLRISIVNEPLGFLVAFNRSGYQWLTGLVFILLGAVVFLMKTHEQTSWIFFLFVVSSGLMITFLFNIGTMRPLLLFVVPSFVSAMLPATIFHLALVFPEKQPIYLRFTWLPLVFYVFSAILFFSMVSQSLTPLDLPRVFSYIINVYTALCVTYFLGICVWTWWKSASEIAKKRAKIISLGSILAVFVPMTDDLLLTFFDFHLLPQPVFLFYLPFYVIFPLSLAYAIVRFNLFEFDAIIRRTYGYLLTTGSLAAIYAVIVIVSHYFFGHLDIERSPVFPFIVILVIVFLFNPIRDYVQRFLDRTFYRLEYDYQETIQRISETMCSLQNLSQVTRAMMDTALGTMYIDSGCLMVLNRGRGSYDCRIHVPKEDPLVAFAERESSEVPSSDKEKEEKAAAVDGEEQLERLSLPADLSFLRRLTEKKRIVSRYDLDEDPFFEGEREAGRQVFDRLDSTLVVPIIYENELKGIMGLGDKKSGKFYRIEDIKLLNTLANQGAVAIENALLLGEVIEKERMEEELSIARDLQKSMLPAVVPAITGFQVAAHCTPAREVGGDFYDFITDDGSQLGIIVGDVTGKGVSGALVMSASRSVFRMLSEQGLGVGKLMTKANDRSKKDIREGMFVAVLYAVLHGEDRSVHLCSAGQTQPILYSAKTGRAEFIETAGDNFPLGIIEGVEYEETILGMGDGDRVVFYTDGVVEAVNEAGEMFGFDRLLEAVSRAGKGDAGAVLDVLKNEVDSFVGKAPQHDDITIIVAAAG